MKGLFYLHKPYKKIDNVNIIGIKNLKNIAPTFRAWTLGLVQYHTFRATLQLSTQIIN